MPRVVVLFLALVVVVVPTMQLASPLTARTLATTLEPPTVPLFVAIANVPSPAPPTITPGFSADPFVPPRA